MRRGYGFQGVVGRDQTRLGGNPDWLRRRARNERPLFWPIKVSKERRTVSYRLGCTSDKIVGRWQGKRKPLRLCNPGSWT
jgi:hypothetical protein